jgi:hypothetical protein
VVPNFTDNILIDLATRKFALKKEYCMLYEQASLLGVEAQDIFNEMAFNQAFFCITSFNGGCLGDDFFDDIKSLVEYNKSVDDLIHNSFELRDVHYSAFLALSKVSQEQFENHLIFKLDIMFEDCLNTWEDDDEY